MSKIDKKPPSKEAETVSVSQSEVIESSSKVIHLAQKVQARAMRVIDYLNAGLAPNSTGAFTTLNAITADSTVLICTNTVLALLSFTLGAGKYMEYKKLRAALEKHGFQDRIMKPKSHTWCQRHASKLAAKRAGYLDELEDYYQREGHRDWHLLPNIEPFLKH